MTAQGSSRASEPGVDVAEDEQRVFLRDVSWADYERIAAVRGESTVPRLTYLRGVLELMSPGRKHEGDKTKLARLLWAYFEHLEVEVEGIGSLTVKKQEQERGAEPDECFVFGPVPDDEEAFVAPDLVVEVVQSSGGLDKLDVWWGLGAKEVWFWNRQRKLEVYVRGTAAFERADRSSLVPALELELVVRCMGERTQGDALRALRAALS
jgi:Uma2 family endonuclease